MPLCAPKKEVTPFLFTKAMALFRLTHVTLLVRHTPPTPFNIFMPNLVEIITSI